MILKMGRKLSLQEVQSRIFDKNSITIIGEYINTHTKTLCKCDTCGYEWEVTPDKLLQGRGCPQCSKRIKGSKIELQQKLDSLNKNITVIGGYVNRNTPILCRCNICNHVWEVRPYDILNKQGCPKCNKCTISEEEVLCKIYKVNPNIKILSSYVNYTTKLQCSCKKCGFSWYALPGNLYQGTGCPKCNMSKGEKVIERYLLDHKIRYIAQYLVKTENSKFYIDFYLPDFNCFIEYNGEQHYKPIKHFGGEIQFNKQLIRDSNLRAYCDINNIQLIEIKFDQDIETLLDSNLVK